MSDLFANSLAIQSAKRSNRMQLASDRVSYQPQSVIATPSDFNAATGSYIALTPDDSEVQYSKGNFRNQPKMINVVTAQNSGIGFGDWQ